MVRWRLAVLVSGAIAISYLDRQALPVAVAAIQRDIPLSNTDFGTLASIFLLAYALMYAGGGALVDRLGTRRGFIVIMVFWSVACASHSLATGFAMLAASRFLLGVGEGGGFPAATKTVAEWFPVPERSTAMGIINAGTAVGAVVAPPAIAAIILYGHWRLVFVAFGIVGLLWTLWWRRAYFTPAARLWLMQASDQPSMMTRNPRRVPRRSTSAPPPAYISAYASRKHEFRNPNCVLVRGMSR